MGALDLKFYISIFFRRLPYFLVVSVLIAAAGISVAMVLPAVYRASATIAVESEQISEDLAASTVGVSATEQIQSIETRMMTRNKLLELADKFDVFCGSAGPDRFRAGTGHARGNLVSGHQPWLLGQ